jgi:hypothetical protein
VAESFSATTNNGDVKVDFSDPAPRTVEATSENGDVRIGLPPRGPYAVNADTGSDHGSTVVRVPRTMDTDSAASVITARSENGDILIDDVR